MGTMKALLDDIKKAGTFEEMNRLVSALEAGALILEQENEDLRTRIRELESRDDQGLRGLLAGPDGASSVMP